MDIRLYYYEYGGLRKWSNKKGQHFFSSIEDAEKFITYIEKKFKMERQWVITEYIGNDSHIIKLI